MKEIKANILEGKYEDILAAVQSPVIALTELIKNAADSCLDKNNPITVNIDTSNKTIEVIDLGEGISENEIEHLGEAGYSTKMVGQKITSPINNPLAGSKGLGLLTAFFISDSLEITTYSVEDKRAYYITWLKGEQKFIYDNYKGQIVGTKVLLKNIDVEKLKMILLPEEKIKLFMTSIRFFTDDSRLPKIKFTVDGKEENFYPTQTLETYYSNNKTNTNGFVAKASFKYEDNKVTLSYEDNVSGFYTFNNKVIDLANKDSVDKFVYDIKAPEKGIVPIRRINESDLFEDDYVSVAVPSFSGVLYTWRNKKENALEQWPVGVRIYVNDYSLYRYLDKDNDWLNLSEISQNVKATNYKLKNTYGYLNIDNYNENMETLKISKERNDFVDSLTQRKFIKIMREIIVAVFTRIDIAVKNPPIRSIEVREQNITVRIDDTINLSKFITCYNMGLDDITLKYDEQKLSIDEDWNVSAKVSGYYIIELSFDQKTHNIVINFKDKIPEFSLLKENITIFRGNTVNLRDYIASKTCKDVRAEDIQIIPKDSLTIIKNDLFDKNNSLGLHIVLFRYGDFQRTLSIEVKDIEKQPGNGAKSPRIDTLFPKLDLIRNKSFKIPELIDGIASYYVASPTLCMAAVRILVEVTAKSFFQYLKNEENNFSFPSLVSRTMNLQGCDENTPDFQTYIAVQNTEFINKFKNVSSAYNTILSKDVKKNINSHVDTINLNMFIHNPSIVASDVTVYKSMQIFTPLINYVFDVLLIEK